MGSGREPARAGGVNQFCWHAASWGAHLVSRQERQPLSGAFPKHSVASQAVVHLVAQAQTRRLARSVGSHTLPKGAPLSAALHVTQPGVPVVVPVPPPKPMPNPPKPRRWWWEPAVR